MFEGARFCPKCGARRARSEEEGAKTTCPGCASELHRLQIGQTTLLECTSCDGLWMDAEVFEGLCADKESQAAVLHRFAGRSAAPPDRVKYRPCVRCGKMMNRINFGKLSGVVVDVCKGHGTYLDPGELHRIVEFIRSGGLERARARHLEELKDQERQVRDAQARLAREHRRGGAHGGLSDWDPWTLMLGDD
jgi:Zn-finger nucleic acid-binding protein